MAYCRYCGAQVSDDAAYCPACGSFLGKEDTNKTQSANSTQTTSTGIHNIEGYYDLTKHILLLLLTFGIWWIIWIYRMTGYLNNVTNDPKRNPTIETLLCLFIPFYQIYWTYNSAQRVDKLAKDNGVDSDITMLSLILAIFVAIVPPIIIQEKLNSIITATGGKATSGNASADVNKSQETVGVVTPVKTVYEEPKNNTVAQSEIATKKVSVAPKAVGTPKPVATQKSVKVKNASTKSWKDKLKEVHPIAIIASVLFVFIIIYELYQASSYGSPSTYTFISWIGYGILIYSLFANRRDKLIPIGFTVLAISELINTINGISYRIPIYSILNLIAYLLAAFFSATEFTSLFKKQKGKLNKIWYIPPIALAISGVVNSYWLVYILLPFADESPWFSFFSIQSYIWIVPLIIAVFLIFFWIYFPNVKLKNEESKDASVKEPEPDKKSLVKTEKKAEQIKKEKAEKEPEQVKEEKSEKEPEKKKQDRNKIIIAVAAVAVIAILAAILIPNANKNDSGSAVTTTTVAVQEDLTITVDGICVDDSYRDSDNSSLRAVYLFYTLSPEDSNLKADSKYTYLTFDGTNTYEANGHSPSLCQYVKNYYYSDYIKDVYVGDTQKVVATFYVPEGDLVSGKTITLKDDSIPDIEKIELTTDDIKHYDSDEAVAEAMDPEGHKEEAYLRTEASEDIKQKAWDEMVGYYWTGYVNGTTYELEFVSNSRYELRATINGYTITANGSYVITNGYIKNTVDGTGAVNWVPYEFTDNDITVDVVSGYDVRS